MRNRAWVKLIAGGLFPALGIGSGTTAEDVKKGAIMKEIERFKGTWQAVSSESDGKKLPEEEVKRITVRITGDKLEAYRDDRLIRVAVLNLDPTKSPKTIDSRVTESDVPELLGKTLTGIYELREDEYTICYAAVGKTDRPTELTARAGTGQYLAVFKRKE
jgi:uncharacterized protein (TIGR03067 family)